MNRIAENTYLYHVTSSDNLAEILKNGFTPRKIAGYFGEGGVFTCLTSAKHIQSYLDTQRTQILQISINSFNVNHFCADITHTMYIGLKDSYSSEKLIELMFQEYGTVGYSESIEAENIRLIELKDVV